MDARSLALTLQGGGGGRVMQGLSGGIVSIADLPAGMLLGVTKDHGEVLRYDVLMEIVFNLLKTAPPAPAPARIASREKNLASMAAGATLVRWSVQPLRPEFETSHLLEPDGPGVWKVALGSARVSVDVQLAAARPYPVTYVELKRGEAPANELVRSYEILTSNDGTTWFYVDRGEFLAGADVSSITFAPRVARFVRLQVLDSFDQNQKISALGRLIVH
jgi:hypothetical protein